MAEVLVDGTVGRGGAVVETVVDVAAGAVAVVAGTGAYAWRKTDSHFLLWD